MTNQDGKKFSLLNYVENFVDKRDELSPFDKDSDERDFQYTNSNRTSGLTNIDYDELNLASDPGTDTRESGEQTYEQSVYLRQYQPLTPEPVDIQVKEIILKPPVHVYIKLNNNRDEQPTPSPIFIKSAPPEPPLSSTNGPIFYNKYIPVNYKPAPRQIVIHHYPELPPKPRPIIIEQWLPNKPPPILITYHHIDPDERRQNDTKYQYNRYIEYKKPHIIIEVEIIRLPIIKLDPQEYQNRSDDLRSLKQDLDILRWRI